MTENAPPQVLVTGMAELVEQFSTAIMLILPGDGREPLGDHHGTGWLTCVDGQPVLCTCEHVANFENSGTLGYTCHGSERGISVGSKFSLHPLPVDFAIASLQKTWNSIDHQGVCIPREMIADQHCPAYKEYLYFYGFPGSDAKVFSSGHYIQGTGVFLHEIKFADEVLEEEPRADPSMHISLALSPAHSTPLTPESRVLPLPQGMSGSALWNTRYQEVTASGKIWSPSDARVTGILWGASQKAGVALATPIQHFKALIC